MNGNIKRQCLTLQSDGVFLTEQYQPYIEQLLPTRDSPLIEFPLYEYQDNSPRGRFALLFGSPEDVTIFFKFYDKNEEAQQEFGIIQWTNIENLVLICVTRRKRVNMLAIQLSALMPVQPYYILVHTIRNIDVFNHSQRALFTVRWKARNIAEYETHRTFRTLDDEPPVNGRKQVKLNQ